MEKRFTNRSVGKYLTPLHQMQSESFLREADVVFCYSNPAQNPVGDISTNTETLFSFPLYNNPGVHCAAVV